MDENIALGIAIGDINPITMKPIIQAKENVVKPRSSSLPSYNEIHFSYVNDPFTCNPFGSVETTTNRENIPLFERVRKIHTKSNSNPISHYQQPLNHDGKIFEMEFIKPLKNNDKSPQSAVRCKENFSTDNLNGMKQMNYHNNAKLTECERLVAKGWVNKYSRKRKWDNQNIIFTKYLVNCSSLSLN